MKSLTTWRGSVLTLPARPRNPPIRKRLLARQAELLEYLTSSPVIFGDNRARLRPPDGFDRRLLDLEARLSHNKRLAKIRSVFARTFEILGTDAETVVREFTDAHPPTAIDTLENARQFCHFLSARWVSEPPAPRHLPDVAFCELAMAEVGAAGRPSRGLPPKFAPPEWGDCRIRRARGVKLLRCAYAIRSIFERQTTATLPQPRDTPLAVVMLGGSDRPQVFEVRPFVFELLAALDDFAHSATLGASSGLARLLSELAEHELIEVCP
jgi:hypothetical protein